MSTALVDSQATRGVLYSSYGYKITVTKFMVVHSRSRKSKGVYFMKLVQQYVHGTKKLGDP